MLAFTDFIKQKKCCSGFDFQHKKEEGLVERRKYDSEEEDKVVDREKDLRIRIFGG